MKKVVTILALVLATVFVLAACGQKKEEPKPASSAATPETAAPAPETSAAPETGAAPEVVASAITVEEIGDLLDRANTLQLIDSAGLKVDSAEEFVDENGYHYNLVVSDDFQSIGAIINYLFDTFTSDAAEMYFPGLVFENDIPVYLYLQDGVEKPGLYMLQAGKGFVSYEPTGEIVIVDSDEDSFTAVFPIDDFGQEKEMTVTGVVEDGVWKIASMEYDK